VAISSIAVDEPRRDVILEQEKYGRYRAGWNPTSDTWSVSFHPDIWRSSESTKVIDICSYEHRGSEIEAGFRPLDPELTDERAAMLAAHALADFFWPDDDDDRELRRIVMVSDATGARYEYAMPD
jgi:hypothetical protein